MKPNKDNSAFAQFVTICLLLLLVGLIGYYKFYKPSPHTATLASNTTPIHFTATDQTTSHTDVQLQQLLSNWARQYSFNSSVVVAELNGNGRTASLNGTKSAVTASTFKIFVGYAVLHDIEQGTYAMNTKIDSTHTIQADLTSMIVNSDNEASRRLGFLLGWTKIDTLLKSQGMNATELNNYIPPSTAPQGDKYTTAENLTTLLTKLQAGTLLNDTDTQLLLSLMKSQNYRERIPAGVPKGIIVADKPGWLTGNDDGTTVVQNDAAIVYGPKTTYILVIMTDGSNTQPLTTLSKLVYNYLET